MVVLLVLLVVFISLEGGVGVCLISNYPGTARFVVTEPAVALTILRLSSCLGIFFAAVIFFLRL